MDSRLRGNDKIQGGPIAYTDYLVINDGTIEELNQKIEFLM